MMRGREKRLLAMACCALILSGCAAQKFVVREKEVADFPDMDARQTFFIQGIAQTQHIDAARVCRGKDKVAAVEYQLSVLDALLSNFTWGIYTPRTVKIYCAR